MTLWKPLFTLGIVYLVGIVIIAAAVVVTNRDHPERVVIDVPPPRPQVALDCTRPQGRHRWLADMISPPTMPDEGNVLILVTNDSVGNSTRTKLDIKGWLCVIDAEPVKVR